MVWTETKDELLCREILLFEPYQYKIRTKEKGNAWTAVADSLNELKSHSFQVDQRAVCDRFIILKNRFESKMKYELNASGISVDERTLVEEALEDIIAKEKEMAKQHDIESAEKSEKVEADKLTAEDMRLQSLETFAKTRKRKRELGLDDDESPQPKKTRNSGTETLVYLREKSEKDFQIRKEELELKKKEQELQAAAQKQTQQANQQMMSQVMNQMREQQNNTNAMFAQLATTMMQMVQMMSNNK